MTVSLLYVFQHPLQRFRVSLWDVRWQVGGFGKHGAGPFASEDQAIRCLRSVGWPGSVERVTVVLDGRSLYRVFKGREAFFPQSSPAQGDLL